MSKKRYRKKASLVNEDIDQVVYTDEESEILGYNTESLDSQDLEEEDIDEEEYDEDLEKDTEEEINKSYKVRSKPAAEKEKYYVNPQEFDDEIVKFYDSGIMSDNLALMVSKIANKLSYAPNFINYTYREEMVGDGIVRMFKALTTKKYDREKGTNPFSYFTRIAFNAFRNRIKKEKHLRDTHEKYQNELMLFSENYNTIVKNSHLRITKKPNE